MAAAPPDKPTIRYAVDRAAMVRRRRYQDDDHYRHFSETAMLEQVCGVEGVVSDLGDGWWRVGMVVDVIAHVELEVLINPGERKIRLREPAPMPEREPPRKPPWPPIPGGEGKAWVSEEDWRALGYVDPEMVPRDG